MNKNEIYIPINSRKEAKAARVVLESLGENVSYNYFKDSDTEDGNNALVYCKMTNKWVVFESGSKKQQITLKQLIELLATGSIKTFEIESKLGELKDSVINYQKALNEMAVPVNKMVDHLIDLGRSRIEQKIAVRVDNEKELSLLLTNLYDKGNEWIGTKKESEEFANINVRKRPHVISVGSDGKIANYQITGVPLQSFKEFAETHGIRVPLLVSEDGVELFKDSPVVVVRETPSGWAITNDFNCLGENHSWNVNPEVQKTATFRKLFSTKQAALEWIEEQKPKEIELPLTRLITDYVSADNVRFIDDEGRPYAPSIFNYEQIKSIHSVMCGEQKF